MTHTVEKIGGTSMSDYVAVRDNIIRRGGQEGDLYHRIFVVSAYGGITDLLLEHKKTGDPGIYRTFLEAEEESEWVEALNGLEKRFLEINAELFAGDDERREKADKFICDRLNEAKETLCNLYNLCQHGHFEMSDHFATVREMLASMGEAHSAWNTSELLQRDGINARFVDLTGWNAQDVLPLDEKIKLAFEKIDLSKELPIVTGYTHCDEGLMNRFDRGYSEMTFSRLAVVTGASEAVIHKEYHLSSADPRLVGEDKVVPIGRTNYDVSDQLAALGMEAIHPSAAKGLRKSNIPLRVKNTFEPEHEGTLITGDYVSEKPCVEIIAGRRHIVAIEVFDQDMMGQFATYEQALLKILKRFKVEIITCDTNANTITHYLACTMKKARKIREIIEDEYPSAELALNQVAIVSAIGSDMQVPGMLAKTVAALANSNVSVLAMHQSMRQVDMQFVINNSDYQTAVKSLHTCLVEVHDHGEAICAVSQ